MFKVTLQVQVETGVSLDRLILRVNCTRHQVAYLPKNVQMTDELAQALLEEWQKPEYVTRFVPSLRVHEIISNMKKG